MSEFRINTLHNNIIYIGRRSDTKDVSHNQSFLSIRFNPYNFKVYAYILIAFLPKQIIDKLLERFTR